MLVVALVRRAGTVGLEETRDMRAVVVLGVVLGRAAVDVEAPEPETVRVRID